MAAMAQNQTIIPVKVGVVLDLKSEVAEIWLSCMEMALSDFYASRAHFNTRLVFKTRDSNGDVVDAAAAALDLIKNEEVQAIIGPAQSTQAKFIIELGEKSKVPIISFSATTPSLTSIRSPYFFRTTTNDSSQLGAISSLVKAFGWREVAPIYVDSEFGEGLIPYLTDALEEIDVRVPYRISISPSATDEEIVAELYKLKKMQTRVFVVHMWYNLGSRLLAKANEIGMMEEGFVWIITDNFGYLLGKLNSSVISSMQGVLSVTTYVPETDELSRFKVQWKTKFQRENPTIHGAQLDVFGLWAYDTVFALAMAVERIGINNSKSFGFLNTNSKSANYSTDLEAFGVSKKGQEFCDALSSTKFRGIAGNFSLVNGQLESSTFKIANVNGVGGRTIGFWTEQNGLIGKLGSDHSTPLGQIIWPGDSTSVPKGWEIPIKGKVLKIGVPVNDGFTEFVKMTHGNKAEITSFPIDVFRAAVDELPYDHDLPYELVPFERTDGANAETYYNDLVYQVYNGTFDAVVGDTTIRANRSRFVDFTLPFTDSGVVMVVPIKDNKSKNAWVFLKPLTWDLWLTSSLFFVFIGFVVWVLEHRINDDFRGPPSHQIGTSFWFSFSTMVFAHREKVVSNLARFVVIIWMFVVLILTQSYTASLTSILTVEQLQPTVKDISQLLKNGENIGYVEGGFVYGLLRQVGFERSRFKTFKTAEECDELLSKGSANGGVAAAFHETPYMKLFLAKYCSKYAMIGPIFKTAGLGFVFPKGSPLVADMSRAILNVTEGDNMKEIENKWFRVEEQSDCPADHSQPEISSNSLSLESFWGLFLIAGVASVASLIIFAITFAYKHRHILFDSSEPSVRKRVGSMFKNFDQKDLSSHTFRKSGFRDGNDTVIASGSPNNSNCPPSPLSYSNSPFSFSGQASPEPAILIISNDFEMQTISPSV
ncbi:hypothetical protein UlMin_035808 [Ulmus minor]